MIDTRCSKCGSKRIECVGVHAYAIAIDDSVEVAPDVVPRLRVRVGGVR